MEMRLSVTLDESRYHPLPKIQGQAESQKQYTTET